MALINTPSPTSKSDLLRSERIAGGILPRVLNSFDVIAILVAIILWVPNAAVVTGAGAVAYIYWVLGFITFLVPGAIVTAQLGRMFPGEGSIYIWTTKAMGNFMGFLAGFCAWWPGILSMMAAGDAVVSLVQQFGNLIGIHLLSEPGIQGLVIIAVLAFSFVLSVLRFRITQNLVNVVFILYGSAIFIVGIAGVLWLVTGHQASANLSFHTGNWKLNNHNFTFYGTVILALLGIEAPLNMGVEMRDTRSITRCLQWGTLVVILSYLIVTFGIMTVVPLKDQGYLIGLTESVQRGFGPIGTILSLAVDLIFIGFFVMVTTVFNYSYGRLLFVSGLDRRLPAIISKVGKNKIPWVAILAQTIIGISFTAIIFVLAPLSLQSAELTTLMYVILLASTTAIWCISMVLLFLDVLIIRHKYPAKFAQFREAPDYVVYICAVVGSLASVAGVYVIFTAPWTNSLDKAPLTTIQWDTWITWIVIISLIVAIIGFFIGRATIKSDLSDEEIIREVTD